MSQDSSLVFETKAIFTLADFLKSLTPNEYYDVAQKLYNEWSEDEVKGTHKKLKRIVEIREKFEWKRMNRSFQEWKRQKECIDIIEENENLKEYIKNIIQENEQLS